MISIIAAMDKNRVIGEDNKIPWTIPNEMKTFKDLTSGNTIIMGRKTFESIGKPLPNRNNIVLSTTMAPVDGVTVCRSMNDLPKDHLFVIGGSQIYKQTIPLANKMYISYVKKEYKGDAFFPKFDETKWQIESREDHPEFELVVYVRK